MPILIHDPEAVADYRRILGDPAPDRIEGQIARAAAEALPSLWSGEAAEAYQERLREWLQAFQAWRQERDAFAEALAAGEAEITAAMAEVDRRVAALPDLEL